MSEASKRSPLFIESPIGILILDRRGAVTDVNPAGCKGFSRSKDRVVGRHLLDWVLPMDKDRCGAGLDRVFRGEWENWKARVRRGDGLARLQEFRGSPLRRQGEVEGALLFVRELPEGCDGRPETLQLQNLLENLPGQFILVMDKRGRVRYSSGLSRTHFRDAYSVLGTPYQELLGQPREGEENLESLLETVSRGESWGGLQWHRRRDGVSFPVEIFASPYLDPKKGHVLGALLVGRDLSMVRELRERAEEAEPLAQIGSLTAKISQEMTKFLDELDEGLSENGDGSAQYRQRTRVSLHRIRHFLEGITEFGETGRVRKESLSLPEFTHEALERAAGRMGSLGVQPTVEVPPNLPPVFADRRKLGRILDLLLENALDALEGTPAPLLRWDLSNGPDGVLIRLTNSGASVEAEGLEKIFAPFFTTKEGRPGLGLATAKGMVLGLEGRIWAEIPQEGFLTLVVELPREDPDRIRPFRPEPLDLTRARSILVVDDEETIRDALRSFLEKVGYEVKEAWSGRSALAALTSGHLPDVVLTDLKMNDGSGYWFLEELSREFPGLVSRTILITGDADHEAATDLASATGCPLVRKPFELPDLLEILDEVFLKL